MIYLRLPAIIFSVLAVLVPVLYLKFSDFRTFQTKEGIVLFITFVASATSAVTLFILSRKTNVGTGDNLKINNKFSKLSISPDIVKVPVNKKALSHNLKIPSELDVIASADENIPDFSVLLEDFKNYIKLESWGLALEKANEILHYYPNKPETEKIRANLSFLTRKIKA